MRKKKLHVLQFERTFVSVQRTVDCVTFWKHIVASSSDMTLNDSPNNIELCAVS